MAAPIKIILNAVVVIAVILWVLAAWRYHLVSCPNVDGLNGWYSQGHCEHQP